MANKRGTQYPFNMDLAPIDWRQVYMDDGRYGHIDIDDEAEAFRDHHLARGTVFKDWHAGYRTWMRNALKWTPKPVIGLENNRNRMGWQQYAKLNGIDAKPGETYPCFQQRVEGMMRRAEEQPGLRLVK